VTRVAGKAAIVTGAGTGIGRAIALALAREGAKVVVAGRRREKLEEVAQAIRRAGGEAVVTVCDVSIEADGQRAVKDAEEAFGHVNVLVNNAGALSVSTVEGISVEEWDRLMATNLKGPFLMSRAVLPAMRRAGGGVIVNVGSVLGLVAMKDRAAYCASKGGVTMLTKAILGSGTGQNTRELHLSGDCGNRSDWRTIFEERGRPTGARRTPGDVAAGKIRQAR